MTSDNKSVFHKKFFNEYNAHMKKIFVFAGLILAAIVFSACGSADEIQQTRNEFYEGGSNLKIKVESKNAVVVYELHDSTAARELILQLPLEIEVENYGSNEKIFYPPKKLSTDGLKPADYREGTLGYFEPWHDVVMYYDRFSAYPGLYDLGTCVSGLDSIKNLSGTIKISVVE